MTDHERSYADRESDPDDDAISLRPYLDTLRRYRRIIGVSVVLASLGFLVAVLGMWISYPVERIGSVQFRLMFSGAAMNQYPNKAPFSPAEIVAPSVVTEVFAANDLNKYGSYESFKNALFIQNSNPALDALAYEYQARLADTKLSPVDRGRIEAEFSQKRLELTDPSFSLSLRRSERFQMLPPDLAEKVLNDTLVVWATHAERAGAMKYQLAMLSSAVLSKESLEREDYLVAADVLRAKAGRIIDTVAELEEVPGALTIRTATEKVSLPEIRSDIEDALRFELEPLLGIIRSEGVTKNARLLALYARTQAFQLSLERRAAEGRAAAVQNSLADYMAQRGARTDSKAGTRQNSDSPALMPQLGESFLTRLIELSGTTQKSDMEYRQRLTDEVIRENFKVTALDRELAYYEDLLKSVENIGNRPAGSDDLIKLIKTRSEAAFLAISKGADQLMEVYSELSKQNLNPAARLYTITGPYTVRSQGSLSTRNVQVALILTLILTAATVAAGCLVYEFIRRRAA